MAADDQDQGYVPLYQAGGQKARAPVQQTPAPVQQTPAAAPVRDPNDQGYVPLVGAPKAPPPVVQPPPGASGASQPSGWGVKGWGPGVLPQPGFGDVTMPQSVQDFGNIAGNEAMMGTIPGLRTEAEAARQRLGLASGGADFAGNVLSPTQLLTPLVGPEAAGAVHEGIKSAVTNWTPDQSWPTYLKNVTEDTAGGAAAGLAGRGVGYAAEKALPELIKGGVTGGAAYLGHKLMGGWAGGDILKEAPGLLGLYKGLDSVSNWAGEKGKDLISSPAAQQAIKNLVLGAGSAFRQGTGPYDQWIPGQ